MNVRHGTQVVVTIKDGRNVLSKETMDVELVDAHCTVQSYMRGGAFGGHNWQTHNGRPPSVHIDLVDPADELKDGELCDCKACKEATA